MSPSVKSLRILSGAFLVIAMALLSGCGGSDGQVGSPGVSTGTVSGVVTSDGTNPLSGVVVATNLSADTATTDSAGWYSLSLPAGAHNLTFTAKNYTAGTATASVAAGVTTTTVNATLAATAAGKPSVTVTADADEIGFGNTTNVHAVATSPSGGTISFSWKNTVEASTTADATVMTRDLATTLKGTAAPSSDAGGYYGAFTQQDQFGILPINPDNKGSVTATVTADDGKGQTTSATITVNAAGISTGLKNVPVGVPVYLNSGHTDPSAWKLTAIPKGSVASLNNATIRNASFTPDVVGKYTLAEGANTMDIYVGTWIGALSGGTEDAKGLPSVVVDSNCTFCHASGKSAPDNFTPWALTPHATFFATGLNGLTSNNGNCVGCHTVGADSAPLAVNNGFDDLAKANSWTYPATRAIGNWNAMWADAGGAKVARMSNIQCENCHGPNGSTGHTTTNVSGVVTQGLRTSMAAEVCASCHASGTGHHNYSEWQQLNPDTGYGHSNRATAKAEAGSGSCARCHTAQGFLQYLNQLNGKVAGNTIGSIATASLAGIVTKDNAEPQTCATCHDPHDGSVSGISFTNKAKPGVPSSSQLRVFNDTPLLPSGFSASGMGAGALCIVCHNSRNGAQTGSTTKTYLHEDGETYNGGNPTGYSAPHRAAQGDVFVGRNAYFLGAGALPMLSKHANIAESCVGCHMQLNPQTHLSHGTATVSKHVFFIRDKDKATVCANCHGATDGEALVKSIEDLLKLLADKMSASVKAKLDSATVVAPVYIKKAYLVDASGAVVLNAAGSEVSADFVYDGSNKYTSVTVTEPHGQIGFLYQLTTPVTFTVSGVNYTVSAFEVGMGALYTNAAMTSTVYALTGNLVRAGWNYFLIEGDESKGIHNPSFATTVLNKTLSQNLSN